ncbi:MAG: hypothetical protein V1873_02280 [Verrucomicrobiota bacterium]
MDILKLVVTIGALLWLTFGIGANLSALRLTRITLGPNRFIRSLLVTWSNAYRSPIVWVQVITAPVLIAWLARSFYHHFAAQVNLPLVRLGDAWWVCVLLIPTVGSLLDQIRPAAVLVLGASTTPRLKLQHALMCKLFPFRVVSLIEQRTAADNRLAAGQCFRTITESWEASVTAFARVVALIILDLRDHTGFVADEAKIIAVENLGYKTIVLVSQSSMITPPSSCRIIETEEELVQVALKCLFVPGFRPSETKSVASWP